MFCFKKNESPQENSEENKSTTSQLLAEYKINAEFCRHHDTLRQKKMENFLTTNSILAAAFAILSTDLFSDVLVWSFALIIGVSLTGFAISFTWNIVMRRNSEYMEVQRLQLCCIENQLQGFTTFKRMYKIFVANEEVDFECRQKPFSTKTQSANKIESFLPIMIATFWLLAAVGSIVVLVIKLIN